MLRAVHLPGEFVRLSRLIGPAAALRLTLANDIGVARRRLGSRRALRPVSVRVRGIEYPLIVRPATSDYGVFRQIFLEREYAPLDGLAAPRLIVDCGANVGYSSAYFLSRFERARVLAVEPDPDNVEVCRRNLAAYGGRAQVLANAVWPRSTRLTLLRFGGPGDCGESGVQVCEASPVGDSSDWPEHVHRGPNPPVPSGEVEALSLAAINEVAGGGPIDLLKMDIEKAELEIFRDDDRAWLGNVRNIAIELHGQPARDAFAQALETYRYDGVESGELTICRGLAPLAPPPAATGRS